MVMVEEEEYIHFRGCIVFQNLSIHLMLMEMYNISGVLRFKYYHCEYVHKNFS